METERPEEGQFQRRTELSLQPPGKDKGFMAAPQAVYYSTGLYGVDVGGAALENGTYRAQLVDVQELSVKGLGKETGC